ncbi:MAG TPA: hypothetical protein VFM05_04365 [Candidatus Saccharimonadales bacterium]|nr:hypothetical protein [Candidatus Saccharimonadales bacterium]
MPVSKRRKPKRRSSPVGKSSPASSSSLAPKSGLLPKKKLSRQQIIIYVISIVMILSLAISYLIGNSGPTVPPTPTPLNAALDTPAPANQSTEEVVSTPTPEPTAANN